VRIRRMQRATSLLQPLPQQNDLDQALKDYVRVSIGLFAPRFDETFEMNIAEQLTIQALAKTFQKQVEEVRERMKVLGDFGDLAV
jgi:hypothetical protein